MNTSKGYKQRRKCDKCGREYVYRMNKSFFCKKCRLKLRDSIVNPNLEDINRLLDYKYSYNSSYKPK